VCEREREREREVKGGEKGEGLRVGKGDGLRVGRE
jgi:hypothetical protein